MIDITKYVYGVAIYITIVLIMAMITPEGSRLLMYVTIALVTSTICIYFGAKTVGMTIRKKKTTTDNLQRPFNAASDRQGLRYMYGKEKGDKVFEYVYKDIKPEINEERAANEYPLWLRVIGSSIMALFTGFSYSLVIMSPKLFFLIYFLTNIVIFAIFFNPRGKNPYFTTSGKGAITKTREGAKKDWDKNAQLKGYYGTFETYWQSVKKDNSTIKKIEKIIVHIIWRPTIIALWHIGGVWLIIILGNLWKIDVNTFWKLIGVS